MGPGGTALFRGDDLTARNSGQWGVSTRYRVEPIDTEFGVYFINFHNKFPQVYLRPGLAADPAIGKAGEYVLVFPEDIKLVGASFSKSLGQVGLAGEVHTRFNMPLTSTAQVWLPGAVADNDENPLYAVGTTLHAQVSAIAAFAQSPLWQSATLLVELGTQMCTNITKNEAAFDPTLDRGAVGIQTVFTPQYFQVLPKLDLSIPIALSYTPYWKAPIATFNTGSPHGGIAAIGVAAEYDKVWLGSLRLSRFYGPADLQRLADRSNLALTLQRTF